jgi:hypothetical protein
MRSFVLFLEKRTPDLLLSPVPIARLIVSWSPDMTTLGLAVRETLSKIAGTGMVGPAAAAAARVGPESDACAPHRAFN